MPQALGIRLADGDSRLCAARAALHDEVGEVGRSRRHAGTKGAGKGSETPFASIHEEAVEAFNKT